MDFLVLGHLAARSEGQPLPIGGPRQRAVLAYLLLHANEVVAAEKVIDAVWHDPPPGGVGSLQTQISRLRKIVGDRLATKAAGYVLEVDQDELDLFRLRALLAAAAAAPVAEERSAILRSTEELWRGEPLSDIDAPFVQAEAAALEELRLGALEERFDADLESGQAAELVPQISRAVAEYPLRERLRGQLILALYRSGRQADALEVYRQTRTVLDEELGLEPSTALRELERAILRHDPSLDKASVEPQVNQEPDVDGRPFRQRRRGAVVIAAGAGAALAVAGFGAAFAFDGHTPRAVRTLTTQRRASSSVARTVPVATRAQTTSNRKPPPTTAPPPVRVVRSVTSIVVVAPRTVAETHRIATTTTAPVRTETRATRRTAAATTIGDGFGGRAPNWSRWDLLLQGVGANFELSDGVLQLRLPSDGETGGSQNQLSVDFTLRCSLAGDFDARVDYSLLEWPPAVGAAAQLEARLTPDRISASTRSGGQYGESYVGVVGASLKDVPTSDRNGTLRVVRRGSVATSYVRAGNGSWIALNSGRMTGAVVVGFGLAAGSTWTHSSTEVGFDNFNLTATSAQCH